MRCAEPLTFLKLRTISKLLQDKYASANSRFRATLQDPWTGKIYWFLNHLHFRFDSAEMGSGGHDGKFRAVFLTTTR